MGPDGDRVFTLKGADQPYRVLVESMNEGAITVTPDGILLYSNRNFADLLGRPLENVMGASLYDVKVLNSDGIGDVADALSGIDWVLLHQADYNIRVINISLATDSTDSYMTDPLCRAVRNAVAVSRLRRETIVPDPTWKRANPGRRRSCGCARCRP